MDILLDQTIHLNWMFTAVITTVTAIELYILGILILLIFDKNNERKPFVVFTSRIFKILAFISILAIPTFAHFYNFPEETPIGFSYSSVSVNENSLNQKVNETYGYSLVEEITEDNSFENILKTDKGTGEYKFETEDGSTLTCSLDTEDEKVNELPGDYTRWEAPTEISAILSCPEQ